MVQVDDRHDRLFDLMEIKDLLIRERYYRDSANWAKLRDCYHPDAASTKIAISWYNGDIDGFVSGSRKMEGTGIRANHDINPVDIHFNALRDKAVSESTGQLRMALSIEDVLYHLISYVRFISKLEKYRDQWYLLSFEAIYESDYLTPDFPTEKVPSTRPLPSSRKSYGVVSWLLERSNFLINQELPGIDRPESVKQIMDEKFAWLQP